MTEELKSIARRYVLDVWGRGDYDTEREIIAVDAIDHHPTSGGAGGLEGHHATVAAVRAAFPDMTMTIDEILAEGDRVVDCWTATGTHLGDFFGIPPTGRSFSFTGIDVLRVADGKIVEFRHVEDIYGLVLQLTAD